MLRLALWSNPQIQVHRVIILWSFIGLCMFYQVRSHKNVHFLLPLFQFQEQIWMSWLILTSSIKLAWHEPYEISASSFITQTVIFCHFILNKAFASTMLNIFRGYSCHFKITAWLNNLFLWCSISNCYLLQFIHFGCQLSDLLAKYLHTLFCTNDHCSINTLVSSGF